MKFLPFLASGHGFGRGGGGAALLVAIIIVAIVLFASRANTGGSSK